jgi:hypothetical protein
VNSNLKAFLVVFAKQAVNAALVSLAPIIATPAQYNLTTHAGIIHVLELVAGAIAAREVAVWVPKLLAWSNS